MSHTHPTHYSVKMWLKDNEPATTREIADAFGVSLAVVRKRLQELRAAGEVHDIKQLWYIGGGETCHSVPEMED